MFDPVHARFRQEWRHSPIHARRVEVVGQAPPGEANSLKVMLDGKHLAFAKPAFHGGGAPRAAHEFLASELAALLDIPVPPVGFWVSPERGPYAISLRAFTESLEWSVGKANLTAGERTFLRKTFAAGCVFHTWIADVDHAGHERNVVLDARSEPGCPQIAFIDHAFSLSYQWTPASPTAVAISPYYVSLEQMPADTVVEIIAEVEQVSEETCKSLVSQIPTEFLPAERASLVLECLCRRKGELASAFRAMVGASV